MFNGGYDDPVNFDKVSRLFKFRDLSERYCIMYASRESVRRWFHKFSKIFFYREEV